jgi:hypothetical protein
LATQFSLNILTFSKETWQGTVFLYIAPTLCKLITLLEIVSICIVA